MKRATCVLAAALLLVLAGASASLVVPPPAAWAEQDLDWDALARMEEQGTEAFHRAGDTDLSRSQRNDAIVEAYGLLKRVYAALDGWCDAHPDQIEPLDGRMVNLNMMVFWLKKDAPVALMPAMHAAARGESPGPAVAGAPSGGAQGAEESSGIGGSSRRTDERPPAPTPPPRESPPPPTSGVAPPPPPDVAAPPPAPRLPPLERARRHDASKPSDVAGSVELWLEVLESIEDTGSPEYAEALGRVSVLSARLKDFYRERLDEDPDAVKRDDEVGREAGIAERLAGGLGSEDAAERRAAADRLASLGWAPAALSIQSALRRERDAEVRDAMFLALVRIGGSRTCETLSRFRTERDEALACGAVRSLAALSRKGPVEARYAGSTLGEFVATAKAAPAAKDALDVLRAMGPGGVTGLVAGIETKDGALQLDVIAAMGAAKDGRAAPALAELLTDRADEGLRRAAMDAIRAIGDPAVPALIEALRTRKTRRYAAIALYEITGQPHGEDAKAWQRWWRDRSGE